MPKPGELRTVKRKSGMKGNHSSSLTLVDKIGDELRERIIEGTFKPGEHLQQAALAKRMGVSSIPLREALRMLEKEGFVEVIPFKGVRVKRLSAAEIIERTEIAFALESYAIELAAPTMAEADFARAEELAGRIYPVTDVKAWNARIVQLLGILCGARDRPVLFDQIVRNRTAARRYTEILARETIKGPKGTRQWASGYFPRLVELMRGGDRDAVKELQRKRLEEFLSLLLPRLAAGAEQGARRGTSHHLKAPKPTRGRR